MPLATPNTNATVRATAPARMDLAGGTLDIYPLYLFEEFGLTVNAAISLGSEAVVSPRDDRHIILRADDINVEQHADTLDALDPQGSLRLLARITRYYLKDYDRGVNVTTRNRAPKGSGLGASSCLLIALSGALNHLTGGRLDKPDLIRIGSELEAQVIDVPTGKQDYYAAAYGGVNGIWFEVGGDRVENLGEDATRELNARVILTFTGEPHDSAISNWDMMRRYISKEGDTRDKLRAIKHTALAMRDALHGGDWNAFADLVDEEWSNRRGLADSVSTPQIERIMAAAKDAGALASKICGAGGGGCMITVVNPDNRDAVEAAIQSMNGQILPFQVESQGLTVSEE